MTSVTNALGRVWRFDYCDCGDLGSITDPLNKTTVLTYDLNGNRTRVLLPDGSFVTNVYSRLGQLIRRGDAAGNWTTNSYNVQGLITNSTAALGDVFKIFYDLNDNTTNFVTINGVSVYQAFDHLDRVTTRTYPDGGVEQFGYSIKGLVRYLNQLGYTNLFDYDFEGKFVTLTNANLEAIRFKYDQSGNLTNLVDGESHAKTWFFDEYGRMTEQTDHLGNSKVIFGYDANDQTTNRVTPAKGTTKYTYDAVGNLTVVDYPASPDITLQYNAANRLTSMMDAVGTTSFDYTEAGFLKSEDGPWANDTISFGYFNRRCTSMTLSQPNRSPWKQSYAYDNANRLQTLASQAGTFTYAYDATRKASWRQLALPNTSVITNSFDLMSRLTGTFLRNSAGELLNAHAYGYDLTSQRTNQVRLNGDFVNYTYDFIGQLKSALGKESGGAARSHEQLGYAYDKAGNLKYRTNNALVHTFNVDTRDQLTTVTRNTGNVLTVAGTTTANATSVSVTHVQTSFTQTADRYSDATFAKSGFSVVDGQNTFTATAQDASNRSDTDSIALNLPATVTFQYDANGNLTNDGRRIFEFDDENQLTRITVTSNWMTEFSYDGFSRKRIQKEHSWQNGGWVKTNETRYVYDRLLPIQERDAGNSPVATYTRGLDLAGSHGEAGGIGGLLARTDHTTGETAFYHTDGSGNITAMVNEQQAIVSRAAYDVFGNFLYRIGPLANANSIWFSSKELHSSGLYYYGFRFYDANLQRWLNEDPIGEEGGINLFGFVGNDPINYIDPYGESVGLGIRLGVAGTTALAAGAGYLVGTPEGRRNLEDLGKAMKDALSAIGPLTPPMPPLGEKCDMGKRPARNKDREGHGGDTETKGGAKGDKHSGAKGHGGGTKPNFRPTPTKKQNK